MKKKKQSSSSQGVVGSPEATQVRECIYIYISIIKVYIFLYPWAPPILQVQHAVSSRLGDTVTQSDPANSAPVAVAQDFGRCIGSLNFSQERSHYTVEKN